MEIFIVPLFFLSLFDKRIKRERERGGGKKRKRKFCAEIFTTRSVKLVGGILYSRRRRKRNLYLIVVYRVGNTSRNIWTSWRDTRQFYIWIPKRRKIETTAGFSFQITRQRRTQSVTRFTSLFFLSFSFLFSSFLFFLFRILSIFLVPKGRAQLWNRILSKNSTSFIVCRKNCRYRFNEIPRVPDPSINYAA